MTDKPKPRCELCYIRDAYNEPYMPTATCCECGKIVCKQCLDPSFLNDEETYVCRLCAVTVYGKEPTWEEGVMHISSEGEVSIDNIAIPAFTDETLKQWLTDQQFALTEKHGALMPLHTSRFRFYGKMDKNGKEQLDLETEFRYPVELDSPENQQWWKDLQQIMTDTGAHEMDVMDEMEETEGDWKGKTCRQVGLWWNVLNMSLEEVKAKMEEVRKATNPLWKDAGVEVW